MINNDPEYDKMAIAERKLWWYKNLHELVLNRMEKIHLSKEAKILDVGCGTGGLMEFLIDKGFRNIEGFDFSEKAVEICNQKGLNVRHGDIRALNSIGLKEQYDFIVSNDVFYFLGKSESAEIIGNILERLKPNGAMVMNVPSLKMFGGIHDKAVGIQQRWNPSYLKEIEKLQEVGKASFIYWPFLLSPIILCMRLIQRIKLKLNKNLEITSDIDYPGNFINGILYGITRLERVASGIYPIGSSMFITITKKKS